MDAAKIAPMLVGATRELLAGDTGSAKLGIQIASGFQLAELEGEVTTILQRDWAQATEKAKSGDGKIVLSPQAEMALRAMREMRGGDVALFAEIVKSTATEANRNEALAALASSKNERGASVLLSLWPELNSQQRKTTLDRLVGSKAGAQAVVVALKSGLIAKMDVHGAAFDKMQTVLGDSAELKELMGDIAALFRPCLRLNGSDNAWAESDITLAGAFTVETWVKLEPDIDVKDGILGGRPGSLDMNFAGELLHVNVGGAIGDVIVAKKKINPDIWTHIAVTRDATGKFRIYRNGELDTDESRVAPQKFEHCEIGWTSANGGTAGWLSEFRVWNRVRTPEEIRAEFDRSYEGDKAEGLVHYYSGNQWPARGGSRVEKTQDFPPLMTAVQSQELAGKFSKFRGLANQAGDVAKGKVLFTAICQVCHSVGAQGGEIGPVLSGAGAMGVESLLRNIITPNAQMEPGYRVFRIELKDGDVLDGRLISEDKDAFILRRPNTADLRVGRNTVIRSHFTKTSMMPEGLLEALKPEEVTDLFSYLKTLK